MVKELLKVKSILVVNLHTHLNFLEALAVQLPVVQQKVTQRATIWDFISIQN